MAVSFQSVLRNFNNRIEEPVRKHLRNVYGCLTLSTAAAVAGAYVNMYTAILSAGFLTGIAHLGFLMALGFTAPDEKNNKLRLGYLLGFSFFSGVGLGPLLNYAVDIDPSIVVTALIGTVLIFSSFTFSVLFAPRGYWLFIGGPINTILSSLVLLSFANLFFSSVLLFQIHVYVGLLLMCAFVVYDTTVIMEKCRMHDKDFIWHSVCLFVDMITIFKNIVVILLEKEKNSKSRSKN